MEGIRCGACGRATGREVISVARTVYRNLGPRGDHAVVTHTVVACSWACAAGLASSLDEAEPAVEVERF